MTKSISIFFPCYNDAKSIATLVREAIEVVRKITKNYEVIVVDDASKDNSRQVLRNLKRRYHFLKLIFHKKNQGYGGALRTGFKAAKKDIVFYTDGDGQYDVKELSHLADLMTGDVDFVNGIKMSRQDPTYRILIGNIYSFIVRWIFWLPIIDVDCDFRLIRKKLLRNISLTSSSGSICVELVKKAELAGGVFRQVSVHHFERRFGTSQFFQPRRILTTFKELGLLWILIVLKSLSNKISAGEKSDGKKQKS